MSSKPIHLISLGAGVQSSTMALMAACGEITPMPYAAIFADTQAEPPSVYDWLDWLEKQLPFPVIRVTNGNLEQQAIVMRKSKKGLVYSKTDIPFFTKAQDGKLGKIKNRSCTADYKIIPLMRKAKDIAGKEAMAEWKKNHKSALKQLSLFKKLSAAFKRKEIAENPIYPLDAWRECQSDALVIQSIGISTDEITRAKESRDPWSKTIWPLIEIRFNRNRCLLWMREKGFPEPPRSACVFCPYHSNSEWRRLKTEEPVQFERAVQSAKARSQNMESIPFLHKKCIPLDQIDFRSDIEPCQGTIDFQDECEGMCGV